MEEGKDFYFNSRGLMVFTAAYHLKRGYCCGNGCLHCPYTKSINEPSNEEKPEEENKDDGAGTRI